MYIVDFGKMARHCNSLFSFSLLMKQQAFSTKMSFSLEFKRKEMGVEYKVVLISTNVVLFLIWNLRTALEIADESSH